MNKTNKQFSTSIFVQCHRWRPFPSNTLACSSLFHSVVHGIAALHSSLSLTPSLPLPLAYSVHKPLIAITCWIKRAELPHIRTHTQHRGGFQSMFWFSLILHATMPCSSAVGVVKHNTCIEIWICAREYRERGCVFCTSSTVSTLLLLKWWIFVFSVLFFFVIFCGMFVCVHNNNIYPHFVVPIWMSFNKHARTFIYVLLRGEAHEDSHVMMHLSILKYVHTGNSRPFVVVIWFGYCYSRTILDTENAEYRPRWARKFHRTHLVSMYLCSSNSMMMMISIHIGAEAEEQIEWGDRFGILPLEKPHS